MKYLLIFITLNLIGCANFNKFSEISYAGEVIKSKDIAKTYYGVTLNKIEEKTFQIYVVIPLSENWEAKIKEIFMHKAITLCDEAFTINVSMSRIHGSWGVDMPKQWVVMSQEATLECERLIN